MRQLQDRFLPSSPPPPYDHTCPVPVQSKAAAQPFVSTPPTNHMHPRALRQELLRALYARAARTPLAYTLATVQAVHHQAAPAWLPPSTCLLPDARTRACPALARGLALLWVPLLGLPQGVGRMLVAHAAPPDRPQVRAGHIPCVPVATAHGRAAFPASLQCVEAVP